MKRYRLTRRASKDLENLAEYIAEDSVDSAISFVERIMRWCSELAERPNSGRKRDEFVAGMRSGTVVPYIIFYRPVRD